MGQVLIRRLWSLAIYGKGHQHKIFWTMDLLLRDNRLFVSERVLVFRFYLCPAPLVLVEYGGDFGSRSSWRLVFSPLHMLQLHDLWFQSVVAVKQLGIMLKEDRTILSWFCGYTRSLFYKPASYSYNKKADWFCLGQVYIAHIAVHSKIYRIDRF